MILKRRSIAKLNYMSMLIFKRTGRWRKLLAKPYLLNVGAPKQAVHMNLRSVYTAMLATIQEGQKAWNKQASSSSPSDSSALLSQEEAWSETQPSKPAEPSTSSQDSTKASTT